MAGRKNLVAFNAAVRSLGIESSDLCAGMVLLGRDLARSLDSMEGGGVSTRTFESYRAVLSALPRWARLDANLKASAVSEDGSKLGRPPGRVNNLLEFRKKHGVG